MLLTQTRLDAYVPTELLTEIEQVMAEHGYKSHSAYLKALVFFDLISHRRHWFTPQLLLEDLEIMERVIREIKRDFKPIDDLPSAWVRYIVHQMVNHGLLKIPVHDIAVDYAI